MPEEPEALNYLPLSPTITTKKTDTWDIESQPDSAKATPTKDEDKYVMMIDSTSESTNFQA